MINRLYAKVARLYGVKIGSPYNSVIASKVLKTLKHYKNTGELIKFQ